MMTVEEYAIDLVCTGAEHVAEDDVNEDGDIADEHHHKACDLAIAIAHAIRANPDAVLALVGRATWQGHRPEERP